MSVSGGQASGNIHARERSHRAQQDETDKIRFKIFRKVKTEPQKNRDLQGGP